MLKKLFNLQVACFSHHYINGTTIIKRAYLDLIDLVYTLINDIYMYVGDEKGKQLLTCS